MKNVIVFFLFCFSFNYELAAVAAVNSQSTASIDVVELSEEAKSELNKLIVITNKVQKSIPQTFKENVVRKLLKEALIIGLPLAISLAGIYVVPSEGNLISKKIEPNKIAKIFAVVLHVILRIFVRHYSTDLIKLKNTLRQVLENQKLSSKEKSQIAAIVVDKLDTIFVNAGKARIEGFNNTSPVNLYGWHSGAWGFVEIFGDALAQALSERLRIIDDVAMLLTYYPLITCGCMAPLFIALPTSTPKSLLICLAISIAYIPAAFLLDKFEKEHVIKHFYDITKIAIGRIDPKTFISIKLQKKI